MSHDIIADAELTRVTMSLRCTCTATMDRSRLLLSSRQKPNPNRTTARIKNKDASLLAGMDNGAARAWSSGLFSTLAPHVSTELEETKPSIHHGFIIHGLTAHPSS